MLILRRVQILIRSCEKKSPSLLEFFQNIQRGDIYFRSRMEGSRGEISGSVGYWAPTNNFFVSVFKLLCYRQTGR